MRVGVIAPLTATGGADFPGWHALRSYALHAEATGFDSVWVFDHLYAGRDEEDPGPIHEAWTTLSALAALTSAVELGQLVTCTSFRSPDSLAAALDKFRDLGIDDLIVSQDRKNPAALDVLRQAVDLSQIRG